MSARRAPSVDELYRELQELMAKEERVQKRKAELEEILSKVPDYRIDLIEQNFLLRAIEQRRAQLSNEMGSAVMREHGLSTGARGGGGRLPPLVFMR
jgi:hypothetical protein